MMKEIGNMFRMVESLKGELAAKRVTLEINYARKFAQLRHKMQARLTPLLRNTFDSEEYIEIKDWVDRQKLINLFLATNILTSVGDMEPDDFIDVSIYLLQELGYTIDLNEKNEDIFTICLNEVH